MREREATQQLERASCVSGRFARRSPRAAGLLLSQGRLAEHKKKLLSPSLSLFFSRFAVPVSPGSLFKILIQKPEAENW